MKNCDNCEAKIARSGLCRACFRFGRQKKNLETVFKYSTNIVEASWIQKEKRALRTLCKNGHTRLRDFYEVIGRNSRAPDQFNCNCGNTLSNDRRKATFMKRFGVGNAMQVPDFFSKQRKSCFASKTFVWPSGRTSLYQGYEHWLYAVLLKTHTEDDIVTEAGVIETFDYVVDGAPRKYYPDAQTGNVIHEVKSWYTYGRDGDINAKRAAVIAAGFTFHLWIFEKANIYHQFPVYPDGTKSAIFSRVAYNLAIAKRDGNMTGI